MRFLCLAYYDEKKFAAMSAAEMKALVSQCPPHDAALHDSGRVTLIASLAATSESVSLRPRDGKPVVTDGPFAETKEQLGSFFILEAADRDEAVALASRHPAALLGEQVGWGVEVRAIDFCRASGVSSS